MSSHSHIRMLVHFSGNVQGVGFRYTSVQTSRHFDVAGTVQNLADGRVRMVVEGTEEQIEAFIEQIVDSIHGHVSHIERQERPATGEFSGFDVLR